MWLKRRLRRKSPTPAVPLFDDAFLRRLERLSFRTTPALRGALGGERRSRNLRPAFDFSDHRAYTSGDDLRHVDWHAYGRHDELFVKLGETTQSVNVHVLLDRSPSMACSPAATKWDGARRLAGALGYLALAGGERLLLHPFGAELDEGFGPARGKRQAIPALQFLTALDPAPPLQPGGRLARILSAYARVHPEGGLLVLISDLLDTVPGDAGETGDGGLAEGLGHFPPPRWQVVVLHLLGEQEIAPALEGDLDLQDVESGERLPFHLDAHTRARYRARVERWCAALQTACARRGAAYSRVVAEWPLERAVIPYLRRRGVVR